MYYCFISCIVSGQVDIRSCYAVTDNINFAILALCDIVKYIFACSYVDSREGLAVYV